MVIATLFMHDPSLCYLLIDISNTFTKIALSSMRRLKTIRRIATAKLTAYRLKAIIANWSFTHTVIASVVPSRNLVVASALSVPILWVDPEVNLGIGIDYPHPRHIGADRLANAVACVALYRIPAIVVDFGTAVTFDVLSTAGNYVGGVIAPGLTVFSEYLHQRTALLPRVRLCEPRSVLGKSSEEAIRSGAVIGYRGLIQEILFQICHEVFSEGLTPSIIATGGDAKLIGSRLSLFDTVNPKLTLEGLRLIATRSFKS
ncbi:Type III pantothenate kinase [Candidatus Xiphinematobacter sp. Idaho Grape]|uniref:type III pantothenate kinase n=1 Tax=Candidatus Xiphinematobacter sp. Idaho Grape TaxID=1704307 RepID=UPI000705C309|nr:type III pantothenate kinase [Candidatus Xiphinematobacter sp. Idaho Grape]ALJ56590.1 Type III pantothenate kinase [Candidatus Xiphinematobacter sp. Idaho Grape]